MLEEIGNEEEAIELARSHRDTTRIFTWNGITVKQAPALIPPLFSGDSFTVFGLIENGNPGDEVTLSGKINSREFVLKAPVSDMGIGLMIPTLWAKNAVRDMETGSEKGSQQKGRKAMALKKRIVELSTRYRILSSETSFVAIETRSDAEKAAEAPVFRRVPIKLTKDWGGGLMLSPACEFIESYLPSSVDCISSFSIEKPVVLGSKQEPFFPLLHNLLLSQISSGWFEPTEHLSGFLGKSFEELIFLAMHIEGIKD
ncbi:MAG: hypothetical protein WCQ99_12195, partial [Pseudomonadota bacterium]